MEKRVLITIAISAAIIFAWSFLFPVKPNAPPPPPPVATAPVVAPAIAPAAPGTPAIAGPGSAVLPKAPESRVTVERPGLYRAVFSTWGAAPSELTLLHPQYQENVWVARPEYLAKLPAGTAPVRTGDDDPNWLQKTVPINLVRNQASRLPFEIGFETGSTVELERDAAWTLASQTDEELVYARDVGSLHLERRWRLPRAGYQLGLTVTVENRGDAEARERVVLGVTGWQDPSVKPGGFSFGRRYNLGDGSCFVTGKLKRKSLDELQRPSGGSLGCLSQLGIGSAPSGPPGIHETGDVKWIGTGEQFFLLAAALPPEPAGDRRCDVTGDALGHIDTELRLPERVIAAHSKMELAMSVYAGPKMLHELDAVTVGGQDARLGDAVNYTLEFVARPMLWLLKQIQRVVINWGIAIILITILLKAVTWYPTTKSMKSMKGMAALKPKLDAIKEKYKDDKNRQNTEVMNLYKVHGINPLGGCLPTLLQMPIYIAFYSMLSNAVELYRASFVGPISDMTAPFAPLAIVAGGLMFLQQRYAPQAPDSQQQKMMMYLMPIMFTAFTIMLPSGLTLYILTNTLLTMAQQFWFNRTHPSLANAGKPAKA